MISSTLYSTLSDASPRSIQDLQNNTHYLEIAGQVYLDGQPAIIEIASEQQILVHIATGPITFNAAALWHVFAGMAEPSAADAGILLAQSIAHWSAFQRLSGTYSLLENALYQALTQAQQVAGLHLPTYRLDALTERALDLYDGSHETTTFLARLLNQDPANIPVLAARCGKDTARISTCPLAIQEIEVAPTAEEDGGQESHPRRQKTSFTPAQAERIRVAYTETTNVNATIAALAQEFGCPEHSIRTKIYTSPDLPKKNRSRSREGAEQPIAAKEEDRSELLPDLDCDERECGDLR